MFDLTKKMAIVTILMTLTSGQFNALGSMNALIEEGIEDTRKSQMAVARFDNAQPQPTDVLPEDGIKLVLAEVSKGICPTDLQLVCKSWRNVMREKNLPQPGIQFSGLNLFMQQCMNIWWTEKFNNGILRYTPPNGGVVIDLKFFDVLSDFEKTKGTFNISACGTTHQDLRMTLSVEEFLKVRGDNENRVVILFATRQMIASLINTSAKPFAAILEGWDPSFPVGIFYKWGNDVEFWVDYLTCCGLKCISSQNLYESWKKSVSAPLRSSSAAGADVGEAISCFIVNQSYDY